jgi:hypothetical protein
MKPRGPAESFLAVAAISGLLFGAMWKVFTGDPAQDSTLIGLAFGVVAGLFSVGRITETSKQVAVSDRDQFLAGLVTKLAEQGYFAKTELENYRLFETVPEGSFSLGPLSLNGWVDRVRISMSENSATVVGPRQTLAALGL